MWYKIQNQSVSLLIFAKPNAKKTALVEISEQGLHIALHAKPQEGEANKELIAYLAKLFGLPKSKIILNKGETSRHKQVIVPINEKVEKLIANPVAFVLASSS